MYEINNENFGLFLAGLRKEKGYTQKALAQKLFVSDKAVSKWERGLSMPDISLLVPLSELLDVTVTELLECRRLEQNERLDSIQVDSVIKKTISLADDIPRFKEPELKKRMAVFFCGSLAAVFEILLLFLLGCDRKQMALSVPLVEIMMFVFGLYFWIFVKSKLPDYYDANKISCYYDGIFRLNMPGVYFNNRNWPHIVKSLRRWLLTVMVAYPALYLIMSLMFEKRMGENFFLITLPVTLIVVFSIFVPVYRNK